MAVHVVRPATYSNPSTYATIAWGIVFVLVLRLNANYALYCAKMFWFWVSA